MKLLRFTVLIFAVLVAGSFTVLPASAARHAGALLNKKGSHIILCGPSTATAGQMHRVKVALTRRVRHGFFFHGATVTRNGADCVSVTLLHPIPWIKWLSIDLASGGHFGIGTTYPKTNQALTAGEYVRYKNDPVTAANQNLPVVKIAIGRPGFVGWSAKLLHRSGYIFVGTNLTKSGKHSLCSFTTQEKGGVAVVVLDRQVITEEQVTVAICGGKLLTGFPQAHSLDKPLGPRELVADLHSGAGLPFDLTVSSIS